MNKKAKPQKDNSERYLLTYADMMNLLLILFIVLYSISKVDAQKAKIVSQSIREGFNATSTVVVNVGEGSSSHASASSGHAAASSSSGSSSGNVTDEAYEKLYQDILALIKENNLQNRVVVQINKNGVMISLSDNVLFSPGDATVSQNSVQLLVSIGNILKNVSFSQIIIEGHTDSDPIHTAKYQDNLDLSTDRANNVNRILNTACGIPAKEISSMGYGDTRPIAPNDTAANKAKNRRVVITVLKPALSTDAVLSTDEITNAFKDSSSSSSTVSSSSSSSSSSSASASSSSRSSK